MWTFDDGCGGGGFGLLVGSFGVHVRIALHGRDSGSVGIVGEGA